MDTPNPVTEDQEVVLHVISPDSGNTFEEKMSLVELLACDLRHLKERIDGDYYKIAEAWDSNRRAALVAAFLCRIFLRPY